MVSTHPSLEPVASPAPGSVYLTPTEQAGTPGPSRAMEGDTEPFPTEDDAEATYRAQQQYDSEDEGGIEQQRTLSPGKPHEDIDVEEEWPPKKHWGMPKKWENLLFYCFAVPSWAFEIAAAVCGAYYHTWSPEFIATVTVWLVLHWAAWVQTVVCMIQRCSWYRDSERQMEEHRQFFFYSVRLQRLMLPTWFIALPVFIVAYVRRNHNQDLAYWLLFLLFFIIDIVGCVMNAYNNISWESSLLHFEAGHYPLKGTRLAILGLGY